MTIPYSDQSRTALLDKPMRILLELRARLGEPRFVPGTPIQCGCVMPPSTDPFYAGLGQAVRIGTELLAALIVGGGLGWVVDTYLLDSGPWGLVAGMLFGAAAGVRNAYRVAQRWPGSPGGPQR